MKLFQNLFISIFELKILVKEIPMLYLVLGTQFNFLFFLVIFVFIALIIHDSEFSKKKKKI